MSKSNRRPAPRVTPRNVAEYVLDLDARAAPGEGDFEVPTEDWRELLSLASAAIPRLSFTDVANDPAREELRQLKALRELERQALAKVLGVGVDTEWDDLLEVGQGYVMALEAEQERRGAELVRECLDTDQPSKLRCPRCLGECANEGKGNCTRAAGRTRYQVLSELDADGRRQLQVDHPAWFCAHAAEKACVLQRPHSGVCVTFDELAAEYAPEEPEHPECPHCGEADGHKPAQCAFKPTEDDDRPTMVESMEKADREAADAAKSQKKKRTSKKFPKGDGELEPCTKCGAAFGEHAGQKCPPKQRRMPIHDVPAEDAAVVEEAPF